MTCPACLRDDCGGTSSETCDTAAFNRRSLAHLMKYMRPMIDQALADGWNKDLYADITDAQWRRMFPSIQPTLPGLPGGPPLNTPVWNR